ncbi:MAG: hypothetical protein K2L92_09845 [Muribaculaceae bacterium]|nr:hypothetical protein [Muribaculaceae bacterium]
MRAIAILLIFAAFGLHASETPDSALAAKADRAFVNGEWAGASALYMLLSDKDPSAPLPYGRLIIAQEMRSDTIGSTATMERALAHSVPVDAVLEPARKEAFTFRCPQIYESFLLRLQRTLPYLRRPIDIRLLRYYTLRRDPARMASYSHKMLAGNPADTDALATLADAAMMTGDIAAATTYWEKILEISPDDYNALAALATALAASDRERAARYARRALAIRPNNALERICAGL